MMITGWRCPEYLSISVALRDSVPFVQFKKREKHLWRSVTLKLVSATFYQIFIFFQMIALQKLWKMFFISSKKLFSFSRYSNFCIFIFPYFQTIQTTFVQ